MTHDEIRAALEKEGLPVPEGELLAVRFQMGTGDWYVKVKTESSITPHMWHWFGTWPSRSKEWAPVPMGPPGER